MPVLKSVWDVNSYDTKIAVATILDQVEKRPTIPFHWFRTILKSPTWHLNVVNELNTQEPDLELLDAPTFFELYRIYLEQNP